VAKTSIIERGKKRLKLGNRFAKKFAGIKERIRQLTVDPAANYDAIQEEFAKLQKIPANASKVRQGTRCGVCGRPKAVYRRFGLCRICLRKLAMNGLITGIRKSSW